MGLLLEHSRQAKRSRERMPGGVAVVESDVSQHSDGELENGNADSRPLLAGSRTRSKLDIRYPCPISPTQWCSRQVTGRAADTPRRLMPYAVERLPPPPGCFVNHVQDRTPFPPTSGVLMLRLGMTFVRICQNGMSNLLCARLWYTSQRGQLPGGAVIHLAVVTGSRHVGTRSRESHNPEGYRSNHDVREQCCRFYAIIDTNDSPDKRHIGTVMPLHAL
jgi:hypothetical protein